MHYPRHSWKDPAGQFPAKLSTAMMAVEAVFEYIKMMHGDASLWESFPRALERQAGARRYVGAFRAPFQDLRLTPPQEHALRACSLLAILPPPPGQEALPGGVPEDLSQDNLSTWAETVQDVAAGMIAPQPEMSQTIFPQIVEVMTLLESVSRVTFCHQCYLLGSACRCLGGSSTASTASTAGQSWSDIADPTFGPNSALAGGRRRIGASIWISSHGRRLHLGSAWSPYCHPPTMPPCWEGLSSGKPTHGHPLWKDCTARSPETSSADLEAAYYTAPPTGSAASTST